MRGCRSSPVAATHVRRSHHAPRVHDAIGRFCAILEAQLLHPNLRPEHPISSSLLSFDASMCIPIQAADEKKKGKEADDETCSRKMTKRQSSGSAQPFPALTNNEIL